MEVRESSASYVGLTKLPGDTMSFGYKQTEVGVIPEDWACTKIDSCIDLLTGYPFASVGYAKAGMRLLRGSNVKRGSTDWAEHLTVFWPAITKDIEKYVLKPGDIVVAMDGSLVGSSFASLNGTDVPALLLQRVARIRSKSVVQLYLKAWICSQRFTGHCDAVKTTTAIPHISPENIRSFNIALPPTNAEQEAIAEALDDADALIESLEQLIAKKRQIKQGTMQALLTGKQRLPGFTGRWESNLILDLEKIGFVKLSRGKVISKKHIDKKPGDFPIYSSSVHNEGLFGAYGDYMFDEELITWSVDGGGNFFHRPKHKFSVTNVCGFMRVDASKISPRFLASELQFLHGSKNFDYMSKAHPSVIRKEYEVVLPPLLEQVAIATILTDMDTELAELETRLAKTRQLKQGMMQELLTGRIRLI